MADHSRGWYLGGAFSYLRSEALANILADRKDIHLPLLELSVGYKHNALMGLEARHAWGTDRRSLGLDPQSPGDFQRFEYAANHYTSIYYRPEFTNELANIYLLIGYTRLNASEEIIREGLPPLSSTYSRSGKSLGLGVGWFLDNRPSSCFLTFSGDTPDAFSRVFESRTAESRSRIFLLRTSIVCGAFFAAFSEQAFCFTHYPAHQPVNPLANRLLYLLDNGLYFLSNPAQT